MTPATASYRHIEAGKTLYQARATHIPRFSSRVAYFLCNALAERVPGPCVVYDPFCGNGVLLVTAYLFFNELIPRLLGSDLDAEALATTRRNFRWLWEPDELTARLRAIDQYQIQDAGRRETYKDRCRRMFRHAQGIRTRVEIFAHDAEALGDVLAGIDAPVALVTDPPYQDPEALRPFLAQAAQGKVSALLLAYRAGVDLAPLLDQYFDTSALNGTRGRGLYCCLPRGR